MDYRPNGKIPPKFGGGVPGRAPASYLASGVESTIRTFVGDDRPIETRWKNKGLRYFLAGQGFGGSQRLDPVAPGGQPSNLFQPSLSRSSLEGIPLSQAIWGGCDRPGSIGLWGPQREIH